MALRAVCNLYSNIIDKTKTISLHCKGRRLQCKYIRRFYVSVCIALGYTQKRQGGFGMNKVVVVALSGIFIASIVLINLLGLSNKAYEVEIPVQKITILNKDAVLDNGGTPDDPKDDFYQVWLYFDYENDNEYQIAWEVYPLNATQKLVYFIADYEENQLTLDKETGTLSFEQAQTYDIGIKAYDGYGARANIKISFKNAKDKQAIALHAEGAQVA